MGLSPILRSEILLIKFRVFEFVVLIDPDRGRSWKSVSSRARYPHFLLSDQRSAIIRPRKSRKTEKPILDFACCTALRNVGIRGDRNSGWIREPNPVLGEGRVRGDYWGRFRRRKSTRFKPSPFSRILTGPFFFFFLVVLSQLLRKGNGRGTDFAQRTASLPVIPPIYTP